jgi:hypothetical protein
MSSSLEEDGGGGEDDDDDDVRMDIGMEEEEEEEEMVGWGEDDGTTCDELVRRHDVATSMTTSTSANCAAATTTAYYAEWNFSVVMHATYRVPTLYFDCAHLDGTRMGRMEVLDALSSFRRRGYGIRRRSLSQDGDDEEDGLAGTEEEEEEEEDAMFDDEYEPTSWSSWEFVSQEEHPISGMPSYFLHPCRTGERMESLMVTNSTLSSSSLDEEEDEEEGDGGNCRRSTTATTTSTVVPLLSWLSMVLPVVGCAVHPDVYRRMKNDIVVHLGKGGGREWRRTIEDRRYIHNMSVGPLRTTNTELK